MNGMQLYLDSYRAFLSVRNGRFGVRLASGEERHFAVREVSAILMTKGMGATTDALLLAVEHDIPVLLIDAETHAPQGILYSGKPGNTALVRRRQLTFSRSAEGVRWVANLLADKLLAQMRLLANMAERSDVPLAFVSGLAEGVRVLERIERRFRRWKPSERHRNWGEAEFGRVCEAFRGQEGTASRVYFSQLGVLLSEVTELTNRQKRPAYEPFNALLNYLYGMLYTSVLLALLKSGIDPYIGVLHADQYGGAPTLSYDFIEPYRPWADEVALRLMLSREIRDDGDDFEWGSTGYGYRLSRQGRGKAIEAMLAYMDEVCPYQGRMLRRSTQVDVAAQALAALLKRD